MRAVIIATGKNFEKEQSAVNDIPELRPLMCRPFIEHVIESFYSAGCTHFDVFLNHEPERFRSILGNGERWGVKLQCHLVRNADKPYQRVRHVLSSSESSSPVLLAHGNRLPQINGIDDYSELPLAFFCSSSDCTTEQFINGKWSGTALVAPEWFESVNDDTTEETICEHFSGHQQSGTLRCSYSTSLDARTHASLLQANLAVLQKEVGGLLFKNNEIENQVWLSRNVVLHPTARIHPPVFISQNCRIGRNVQLGSGAVIAENCVIDTGATVERSMVLPNSYIGEGLELTDAIVDKNRLINTRLGSDIALTEDFILGNLGKKPKVRFRNRLLSRLAAVCLLIPTFPVLLLTLLWVKLTTTGSMFGKVNFLCIPASNESRNWKIESIIRLAGKFKNNGKPLPPLPNARQDFFFRFLPGLLNVLLGKIHIVGMPPRSPEDVRNLPDDWQSLYLTGKTGLITEIQTTNSATATPDEEYAADIFYAASFSFMYDFKLFLKYIRSVCRGK